MTGAILPTIVVRCGLVQGGRGQWRATPGASEKRANEVSVGEADARDDARLRDGGEGSTWRRALPRPISGPDSRFRPFVLRLTASGATRVRTCLRDKICWRSGEVLSDCRRANRTSSGPKPTKRCLPKTSTGCALHTAVSLITTKLYFDSFGQISASWASLRVSKYLTRYRGYFTEEGRTRMTTEEIAHPLIVAQDEWLAARNALLAHEKELTRQRDRINAERRRLPMVKIEKDYRFDGPNGKQNLMDLFEGRRQLVVYHFMFGPDWDKGCPGCTGLVKEMGDLSLLNERDTTFALISRAPLAKLEAYKASQGWRIPWYSSFGNDFNYDFHVSDDKGEGQGLSVFFRLGADVFHTYSTYQRGVEALTDSYSLLDTTPYGRQEDFEDSPPGWPQHPTYG